MASFLETLMALNRAGMPMGELPPMPAPAQPMQIMPSGPLFAPPPNPMPGPAPIVAMPALDQNLIASIAGPAPVQQQPSFLDKLATVLQGISAGAQGQGPQYAQSIREQRERPQREYEARKLVGVEAAQRKQEREQAAAQRRADIQSDREFEMWAQSAKITAEDAKARAREAFLIQKQHDLERAADERQQIQIKAANERQARQMAQGFIKDDAPPDIADNLSQHIVFGTPLSPAAEKWRGVQAKKTMAQIARLQRLTGGGGGGGGAYGASPKAVKAVQQFEATKQKLIEAAAKGDAQGQKQLMTELNRRFRGLGQFPELETGYGGTSRWPYVKIRTPQGSIGLVPQQPGAQTAQPAQAATTQKPKADPLGIR